MFPVDVLSADLVLARLTKMHTAVASSHTIEKMDIVPTIIPWNYSLLLLLFIFSYLLYRDHILYVTITLVVNNYFTGLLFFSFSFFLFSFFS